MVGLLNQQFRMKKRIFLLCLALFSCSLSFSSCNNDDGDHSGSNSGGVPTDGSDYIDRDATYSALEGWKFRCKVLAEQKTVEEHGGKLEFMKKMDALLASASEYFQVKGINDEGGNQVHFFMSEMEEFSGASRRYMNMSDGESSNAFDLRIIVNDNASEGDLSSGWMPAPYMNLGHDADGIFGANAAKTLAHNLGHARGVPDLDLGDVDGKKNMITGNAYAATACLMNNKKRSSGFCEYARLVINNSGANRIATEHHESFPASIRATVVKPDGSIASGAQMKFFPVYNNTLAVANEPRYSGSLSVTGNFIFSENPFIAANQNNIRESIPNYLVEVTYDKVVVHRWMSMFEAETAALKGNDNYIFKVEITEEEMENSIIPDNDYIANRLERFENLPGWKFRVKILGEEQTVEDNGGRIAFMKKVDQLLLDASERFQEEEINAEGDNQVHFYMTSMEIFSGSSREQMYKNDALSDASVASFDLRIIINGHPVEDDVSGGWLGSPYLNLGHDWGGQGGLWSGWGIDCLVHELGHTRGVPDLYAMEVTSKDQNPVNGTTFEAITCTMNYHYGGTPWSDYAIAVINASAGGRLCIDHTTLLPQNGYQIKVADSNGTVVADATVNLYPIYSYSYAVDATALYTGTTDSNGVCTFAENIYRRANGKDVVNHLVEVIYNNKKTYKWMPIYEPELATTQNIDPFVKQITLAE